MAAEEWKVKRQSVPLVLTVTRLDASRAANGLILFNLSSINTVQLLLKWLN